MSCPIAVPRLSEETDIAIMESGGVIMQEIKDVKWAWDYGVYIPFCPYCDEPAYEKDKCFACGKAYRWVEGEYKPTEVQCGEYTVVQSTNNHVHIYKDGSLVMHSQCTVKKTEEELRKQVEFYEKFCKSGKFDKIYNDDEDEKKIIV